MLQRVSCRLLKWLASCLRGVAMLGADADSWEYLGEVGQRATMEAEGDAFALHILLPHARNHLHPTTLSIKAGACWSFKHVSTCGLVQTASSCPTHTAQSKQLLPASRDLTGWHSAWTETCG